MRNFVAIAVAVCGAARAHLEHAQRVGKSVNNWQHSSCESYTKWDGANCTPVRRHQLLPAFDEARVNVIVCVGRVAVGSLSNVCWRWR